MFCWTGGSNPYPSEYQADAHPTELPGLVHQYVIIRIGLVVKLKKESTHPSALSGPKLLAIGRRDSLLIRGYLKQDIRDITPRAYCNIQDSYHKKWGNGWGSVLTALYLLLPCILMFTENIWTASSEFGIYSLCEQRRFRRAYAYAQSRQNLRCSLI